MLVERLTDLIATDLYFILTLPLHTYTFIEHTLDLIRRVGTRFEFGHQGDETVLQ